LDEKALAEIIQERMPEPEDINSLVGDEKVASTILPNLQSLKADLQKSFGLV